MTIIGNISFLAQSQSQINRLSGLNETLSDLQRQATTLKKHETFSGFGTDALTLQRFRSTQIMTQRYLDNIEQVTRRMTIMNNAMAEIAKIGAQIVSGLSMQSNDSQSMQSVTALAQQNLKFIEDLLNQQTEGRYLFAGSDITTPPFVDDNTLNANFSSQISSWLGGGQTNAQLTATTDAFTTTELGLSNSLATTGSVTTRIDDNLDLNYTIKADDNGFKDILNALTFVANLRYPTPPADVATPAQFKDLVSHITSIAARGVQGVNTLSQSLSSKFALAKSLQEKHTSDGNLLAIQIDKIENSDTTDVVASMQALQTQLTTAYQVTNMVSKLSLVNFL